MATPRWSPAHLAGAAGEGVDYVVEKMPQKIREDEESPVTTDEESDLSVLT